MDEGVFNQPTQEQIDGFVTGDPVATDEVLELLLPQVYRWAVQRYRDLPPAEVHSEIHQVCAEVCVNHARYDPARSKLTTYIINLLTLRLKDLRERAAREPAPAEHKKDPDQPYNLTDDTDRDALLTRLARDELYGAVEEHLEPDERAVFALMREGEIRLRVFAAALERYGPVTEPAKQVNNAKARVRRRVRAVAFELGYSPDDLL
jgi:DNA-directed RNA polymerase specialized sigma24 family protein